MVGGYAMSNAIVANDAANCGVVNVLIIVVNNMTEDLSEILGISVASAGFKSRMG